MENLKVKVKNCLTLFFIVFQFGIFSKAEKSCKDSLLNGQKTNPSSTKILSFPFERLQSSRPVESDLQELTVLYAEYTKRVLEFESAALKTKSTKNNEKDTPLQIFDQLTLALKEWTRNSELNHPNQKAVTDFINNLQFFRHLTKLWSPIRIEFFTDDASLYSQVKIISELVVKIQNTANKIKIKLESEFRTHGLNTDFTQILIKDKDSDQLQFVSVNQARTEALEPFLNRLGNSTEIPLPNVLNGRLNYEKYLIQAARLIKLNRDRAEYAAQYWEIQNQKHLENPDYQIPYGKEIPFPPNLKFPSPINSDRQLNEKAVGGYRAAGLLFSAKGKMRYQKTIPPSPLFQNQVIKEDTHFSIHGVSIHWPLDWVYYFQNTADSRPEIQVTQGQFYVTLHGSIEVLNQGKKVVVTENLDTPVDLEPFINKSTRRLENFSWKEPKPKINGVEVRDQRIQKSMSYDGKILRIFIPNDLHGKPSLETEYVSDRWYEIEVDPSLTDFKSIQIKMETLNDRTNALVQTEIIQTTNSAQLYSGINEEARPYKSQGAFYKPDQFRKLLDFLKPAR